jgi:hypothetical protein
MPGPDHIIPSTETLAAELDALIARFGLSAVVEAVVRLVEDPIPK